MSSYLSNIYCNSRACDNNSCLNHFFFRFVRLFKTSELCRLSVMLRILSRPMRATHLLRRSTEAVCVSSTRNLNLLEYQSKELLRDCGVSVQNFAIVDDLTKTSSALEKLRKCIFYFLFIYSYCFIICENYICTILDLKMIMQFFC